MEEINKTSAKKILIADNSSLILSILRKLLEEKGFHVCTAVTGEIALELVKTEKPMAVAVNSKLALINGTSLCRIIKQGMEIKDIFTIVYSVDPKWRNSADFSCVNLEIPASDNEAEVIVESICTELDSKGNINFPDSLDLPISSFVNRAMEKNLLHSYIMESLYECGHFFTDLEKFSQALLNLLENVFNTDALVLILNGNPIQIYGKGIKDNSFGQNFLRVCFSDFETENMNRKFISVETHFLTPDKLSSNTKSFSSYKSFPLFSEDLLGTVHMASFEKQKFGTNIDESIVFFQEKVSLFLAQALHYKKASQIESRLRTAFSRFVPKEIIDELAEVGDFEIGEINDKRKVAVLICDIRNFTTISEINQPENVVSFLNGYFMRMVDVIKKHGGTIDKFMGDAVMALFGAPVSYEDNAKRAVDAALEMKALVPEISCENLIFPENIQFDIGIGIHYGEVIAGGIGCKEKTDYTVIGDTVNLASRLEGLTKSYGAGIIISGAVKAELSKSYNLLHLDNVKVKGKSVSVEIYRVDLEQQSEKYGDYYTKALELYESGAWNLAVSYFEKALKVAPNDSSATMMAKRCREFILNPPKNWDGAYSLTKK